MIMSDDINAVEQRVEDLLSQLTLEEKKLSPVEWTSLPSR